MKKVYFAREGLTVFAEVGQTLLEVMRSAGIYQDAPCGGAGKCGKCKVRVRGPQSREDRTCLACQEKVTSDLSVETIRREEQYRILTESMTETMTESMTETMTESMAEIMTECGAESMAESGTGSGTGKRINDQMHSEPMLRQVQVEVPPCPAGESISDWTRLDTAIRTLTGRNCPMRVNPGIASETGPLSRRCGGKIWAVLCLDRVLAVREEKKPCCMAAFDIGTTTVAAYLLDEDGREIAVCSEMNPQARFGADVINRANYCLENGMEQVTACIRETVNHMIGQMAKDAGLLPEDIYVISIAGNTCMHHFFLGISVDSLVHAPYNPALQEAVNLRARDYGISANSAARLMMLPNIAGFVGADTVGCLLACDLSEQEEWTLLVDIGTNGEMVLGRKHQMAACSTAAGPAFEGAGITHGMRGSLGAISRAVWTGEEWKIEVIGGGKARGICGSGLLDVAAELLRSGQMDEYGEMLCGKRVVLADGENSENGLPITVEQKDIRQLQLAKAAVASGIHLLAKKMNIGVEEISRVWLAGAFGTFLSPDSACEIGLLPPQLRGRIRGIGNAAGEGAKRLLRDASQWERASRLARETQFLELAAMSEFQDRFVEELEFPETGVRR